MTVMPGPHERLDEALEARRIELGMEWVDVAEAAGRSAETIRSWRRGESRPRAVNKRKLERAMNWAAGSIDAVLAGDNPVPLESAQTSNTAVVTRLVGMVRAGASFPAIIAEVQDKPPREQVEILRRVAAETAIPDVSNQDAR
jgi:hypothetical protein